MKFYLFRCFFANYVWLTLNYKIKTIIQYMYNNVCYDNFRMVLF